MSSIKIKGGQPVPFMADFLPLKSLWDGPAAPYPSEFAARWAIRKMRPELAEARAVAMHRNRIMVHPQRFAAVAEDAAVQQFARSTQDEHVEAKREACRSAVDRLNRALFIHGGEPGNLESTTVQELIADEVDEPSSDTSAEMKNECA